MMTKAQFNNEDHMDPAQNCPRCNGSVKFAADTRDRKPITGDEIKKLTLEAADLTCRLFEIGLDYPQAITHMEKLIFNWKLTRFMQSNWR